MSNFNTKGISVSTVAITDYKLLSASVAKIVVAFTGKHTPESISDMVTAKLKHLAAPIENSFRPLGEGRAVGFVRANRAVRAVSDQEITAGYKVIAKSNILMDNTDSTLWKIKEGAAGKYLAREGNEDLSELISASVHHRADVPKVHQVGVAAAVAGEFVAFASASGDVDYGFCIATKGDQMKVVSASTNSVVKIEAASMISAYKVPVPREAHQKITAAGISREDAKQAIDYWTQLYSYAPDYLAQVIDQVNGTAVA